MPKWFNTETLSFGTNIRDTSLSTAIVKQTKNKKIDRDSHNILLHTIDKAHIYTHNTILCIPTLITQKVTNLIIFFWKRYFSITSLKAENICASNFWFSYLADDGTIIWKGNTSFSAIQNCTVAFLENFDLTSPVSAIPGARDVVDGQPDYFPTAPFKNNVNLSTFIFIFTWPSKTTTFPCYFFSASLTVCWANHISKRTSPHLAKLISYWKYLSQRKWYVSLIFKFLFLAWSNLVIQLFFPILQ